MGIFGAVKNKPTPTTTQPLNHIKVTQSILGQAIAILNGQRRLHMNLISYAGFKVVPITTTTGGGGKGIGGGGSNKSTSTTYTYFADIIAGLCEGLATGVVNVWDTKGSFQQSTVSEQFTVPGGGGSYQVANHLNFENDLGVGVSLAYSQGVNDYGSPGPSTLSGTYLSKTTNYTLNPATGTYSFPSALGGASVTISYSYNLLTIKSIEDASIPPNPWMLTVENSAQFLDDLGVIFYPSGVALKRVIGSITGTGQYKVAAGGIYTFFSGDQGLGIQITYTINDTNTSAVGAAQALNFTLFPGVLGEAPWGLMTSNHPELALGYSQLAKIVSSMQLGSNAEMPNYTFELIAGPSYGGGIPDCCPTDCITQILTNQSYGVGAQGPSVFPSTLLGEWTVARNFWIANGFFISPLLENQRPCNSVIKEWLEAGITASFFSEGKLKLVPYGDSSAAGNGAIYVAPTQPVVDLSDNDFVVKKGEEPIKPTRIDVDKRYNRVTVQYANRLNAYNPEPLTEQDEASINRFNARPESPVNWDFICTQTAATFAASMRVKRFVNILSTYQFTLGWRFSFLEPMDIVTLTKLDENGNAIAPFNKLPVRITKTEDDPIKGITITAEDFPWGTATPALYQKQGTVPVKGQPGQADPGNTKALILEVPDRPAKQAGNILYIFCSPDNNNDWGGCTINRSFDGVTYEPWGEKVRIPARMGALQNSIAAGSGSPSFDDVTNVPQIKMNSGQAFLGSASQTDFDQFNSLCALINPSAAVPVNLASFFNLIGIYADGATFGAGAGLDGNGFAMSSTLLVSPLVFDATFNIGSAGVVDVCRNTTITLPNQIFTSLKMLAMAVNGAQASQTFTITYQDNTTDTITQSISDWAVSSNFANEAIVIQFNYRNKFDGTRQNIPIVIYEYTFPVNPSKAVKNIILPANNNVVVAAITMMFSSLELFAYRDSTLSAGQTFSLAHLHRGTYGTPNQPHSVGETFVRLDQASSEFQYDPSLYGKTIFLKFTSFNTLGFREQDISQVQTYQITLQGSGPGFMDLATAIIRQAKGSVSNTWAGAVSFALTTTTATITWSGLITRASVPAPGQQPTIIKQVPYSGSQPITGLTAGTQYWLYRYIDDSMAGSPLLFVNNAQVGGAIGSPAIAYVALNALATQFCGRNDHSVLDKSPLTFTTPASGTSSGSGGGTGGTCPRGDMVVEHREKGVLACSKLSIDDWILGQINGRDVWVRVKEILHKRRREWIELDLACGEAPVVTPAHQWPTEKGIAKSHDLTIQSMLKHRDGGFDFLASIKIIRDDDQISVSIEVDSPDHSYYLGRVKPVILSQNNLPDIS